MAATASSTETSGKAWTYRCYLVRCRLEMGADSTPAGSPTDAGDRAAAWRFTVERVRPDAARRSFASIHDVAAYIDAELTWSPVLTANSARQDSNLSNHSEVEP